MLVSSKKLPQASRVQGGSGLGDLDWEVPREGECFRPDLCWLRLHLLTAPERASVPKHGHPGLPCRCP